MRNEQGVALVLALIVLVALTGLLLAFLSMAAMEPQIARNLTDVTQARYVAETGIEWAYDQLATAPATGPGSWNALLAAGGTMATSQALPGLPATSGTFTVTLRNDTQPSDPQITGQPVVDPGGPANDTNGVVILNATGTVNGVTRTIQAAVTRLRLPTVGALAFPGVTANTAFADDSLVINGNDTNPDGTAGPCAPAWGIAVATAAERNQVLTALGTRAQNVSGKPINPASPGVGANTIASDATLTPARISKYVDAVKGMASISLQSSPAAPLVYSSIGSTCATNWNSPTCWGTRSQPKLVYVKGTGDPTYTALTMAGTGVGTLIVEDGSLAILGNLQWEGPIIVTGKNVAFKLLGVTSTVDRVYGSVIVNETFTGLQTSDAGNTKLYYSCQALNNAMRVRSLNRLTSWREL